MLPLALLVFHCHTQGTFTSNGIVYGNGTGALQATAAGTDGYILYSNSGTPDWTNTLDGGSY